MQISKFPFWICALALCGGMTLRAEDTPAQAAARAALMQKMQQAEGNPPPAAQTPAPKAAAPAAVQTPAPAVTAPAAAATTSAVEAPMMTNTGSDMDTPAQAAARAALMEKMQQMGGNPPAAAQTPAPKAVVSTAVQTPAPTSEAPMMTDTVSGVDTTAQAAARAAMQKKLQEVGGAPAPASVKATREQIIAAPALPINMSKEQKLNWLTQLYKSDQLSPEQYHEQRAAILAEP